MENLYPHGKEDEHEVSGFTVSELKTELEKISNNLPLLLEFNQESNKQRCYCKSCPCGNNLDYPNSIIPLSPIIENFQGDCIGSQNKASDSLSILYKKTSLYKSSGFSVGSQKIRRSRSIDVVLSPSERWVFDSIDANIKARALLESSLIFQFGGLDSRRSNTRLIKSSEMCNSPSNLGKTFGRRSSELSISESKLLSSSTSSSANLWISPSSTNIISKGFLYCVWKSGVPYFLFSLDNNGGDAYLANAQKMESLVDKSLDYVYLFRSVNSNASHVVGKMKVSSSLVLSSNGSKLIETEFVLFGSIEDYSKELQISSPTLTKRKGLLKKVTDIFKNNQTFNHKAIHKHSETLSEIFMDELRDLNELDYVKEFAQDFQPNLELASIVVKDYQQTSKKEAAFGGWGLKFLENFQVGNAERSQEGNCTKTSMGHTSKISVIVPSGFHGGPFKRNGGPSSLIERWKSNGRCDCGSWDLGCPLTVINNDPRKLLEDESEGDCQTVNLFVEGKHKEPTFKMMNKSKDLYVVYFHSSLSALQSFSIAVAIVHNQTLHLYSEL